MVQRHLGLKLDEDLIKKLRYVAEYEGRSMNGLVRQLIRNHIHQFEEAVEKIEEV